MTFLMVLLLAILAWQLHGIRQEMIESNQRLRSLRIALQGLEPRSKENTED
jgi:hypothetical protein